MLSLPSAKPAIMPLMLTKRDLTQMLGGRVDLMRRLLYAEDHGILACDGLSWVQTVIRGTNGRERMLDTDSCLRAYARIRTGELPPLLPSAQRGKLRNSEQIT